MKKLALIIALFSFGLTLTFGQTVSDSISIKKVFGGYQFLQGNKILNMNQLARTLKPNEQAYKEITSAQSTYALAMILGYAGGFMIGYPLGTAIGGGEPNWALAGIGAGLFIVSIPISQSYYKKVKKAVETYNSALQTSSFWDNKELKFSMTGNGLGLTLRF